MNRLSSILVLFLWLVLCGGRVSAFLSADPLGHASSMSLYDYCNGDPVNGLDPDGRFGSKFSANIEQGYGLDQSASLAFSGTLQDAAVSTGSPYLAYPAGFLNAANITATNFMSPGHTLQSNYAAYGDLDSAVNASFNPLFSLEQGSVELYTGMGISPDNSGQTLNSGQLWMSGFKAYSGAVGTAGIGFGVSSVYGSMTAARGGLPAGFQGGPGAMYVGENLSTNPYASTGAASSLMYHYTTSDQSSFANGLRAQSSVTPTLYTDPLIASQELGIPVPNKVIPILDVGQFQPNKPVIVQPSYRFDGGGLDFTNPEPVPPSLILPAQPIGGG